jgi:plastocyanin
MRRSSNFTATAAAALLALAAGCGGSDDGGGGKTARSPSAGSGRVEIADFKFMPPRITVAAGTKLVFANDDTAAHTATAADRSFDTGSIRRGKRAAVTLAKPGTYAYICDFHPFMKGTVVVER